MVSGPGYHYPAAGYQAIPSCPLGLGSSARVTATTPRTNQPTNPLTNYPFVRPSSPAAAAGWIADVQHSVPKPNLIMGRRWQQELVDRTKAVEQWTRIGNSQLVQFIML